MEAPKNEHQARLAELDAAQAMVNDEVMRTYFNAFSVAVGPGDATLLLKINDKPVGVLHSSLSSMKDMAEKVLTTIQDMERGTGITVTTVSQYLAKFDELNAKQAK